MRSEKIDSFDYPAPPPRDLQQQVFCILLHISSNASIIRSAGP
jgi:hypothetical protein